MRNPTFKNEFFLKTALFASIFTLFLFSFYLSYNKESVSAEDIYCDPEIPMGEPIDESLDFLTSFYNELKLIDSAASNQIKLTEDITKLGGECNTANCSPVCQTDSYECGSWSNVCKPVVKGKNVYLDCQKVYNQKTCYLCKAQACGGQVCDNGKISDKLSGINSNVAQISDSYKKIKDSVNNDLAAAKKKIKENLGHSREEFDKCYIAPNDIMQMKSLKNSVDCTVAVEDDYPRKNKDCQSKLNFFCCQ